MLQSCCFQLALVDRKQKWRFTEAVRKENGFCHYGVPVTSNKKTFIISDKESYKNWSLYQKEEWAQHDFPVVDLSWLISVLSSRQIIEIEPKHRLDILVIQKLENTPENVPLQAPEDNNRTVVILERISLEEDKQSPENNWETAKKMTFQAGEELRILSFQFGQGEKPYRLFVELETDSYYEYVSSVSDGNCLFSQYFNSFLQKGFVRINNPIWLSPHSGANKNSTTRVLIQELQDKASRYFSEKTEANGLEVAQKLPSFADVEHAESIILQFIHRYQHQGDELFQELTSGPMKSKWTKLKGLLPYSLQVQQIGSLYDLILLHDELQLMKDLHNVQEEDSAQGNISIPCRLHSLDPTSFEYHSIYTMTTSTLSNHKSKWKIGDIIRAERGSENVAFDFSIGNQQLLFHGTRTSNILGILSRGLMIPYHHSSWDAKISLTLDEGLLGRGIYFSDSASTCLKYCETNSIDETVYVLLYEVAVGRSLVVREPCVGISSAPPNFHSLHASPISSSTFTEDEYCIYNTNQQKLRYIITLHSTDSSKLPSTLTLDSISIPSDNYKDIYTSKLLLNKHESEKAKGEIPAPKTETSINQLVGLLSTSGTPENFLLQRTECITHIIDMVAKVKISFVYENSSDKFYEGKFVFPLPSNAAVSGFECFINDKHLSGIVKERSKAREEYTQAVEENHGAFLLEQDDVSDSHWTVSIGNIPPHSSILITISYVNELEIEKECILFRFPSAISDIQKNNSKQLILQKKTQSYTHSMQDMKDIPFFLSLNMEVPRAIRAISCTSGHDILSKYTQTKAVVQLNQHSLDDREFRLNIRTDDLMAPRLWLEQSPSGTYAAMVSLFPQMNGRSLSSKTKEVLIVLDRSASLMPYEMLLRSTLTLILESLPISTYVNIISYGNGVEYLLPISYPVGEKFALFQHFISSFSCNFGGTFPLPMLSSLSLLGTEGTKILWLTDGKFGDDALPSLDLVSTIFAGNLFPIGIGLDCHRHTIYSIARAGRGKAELITQLEHAGIAVTAQCKRIFSPSLSHVEITWNTDQSDVQEIYTAPSTIPSLFVGERQVSYCMLGDKFCISANCTATFHDKESGRREEMNIIISSSESCTSRNSLMIHSLCTKALIDDFESDSACYGVDRKDHQLRKADVKAKVIEWSVTHQIASKYTSFLAIEERNPKEDLLPFSVQRMREEFQQMLLRERRDLLPEMGWDSNTHVSVLNEIEWDSTFGHTGNFQNLRLGNSSNTSTKVADPPSSLKKKVNQKAKKKKKFTAPVLNTRIFLPTRNATLPPTAAPKPQISRSRTKQTQRRPIPTASTPTPTVDGKSTSIQNLQIREDTAKYLRNLDTESALYDPKTRSMRGNPVPRATLPEFKPHTKEIVPIPRVVTKHLGTGVATRSGKKTRNKLFKEAMKIQKRERGKEKKLPNTLHSPFGFRLKKAPKNSEDTALQFLLKGPINKIRGGCCWLDAILALGLTIIDYTLLKTIDHLRKPPTNYSLSWVKEEKITESLLRFYFTWVHSDFSSYHFRKDISIAHNIIWMQFEEQGFAFGEPHCAIVAFYSLLDIIVTMNSELDIANSVGHVIHEFDGLASLVDNADLGRYIIYCNRDYSSLHDFSKILPSRYELHSLISFEGCAEDPKMNHFTCVALTEEGYFLYDDLLLLPNGGWQGGFVQKKEECFSTNMHLFLESVPLFILRQKCE